MKKIWEEPKLQVLDIRETMGGDRYFGVDSLFDFDFTKPPKEDDVGSGPPETS